MLRQVPREAFQFRGHAQHAGFEIVEGLHRHGLVVADDKLGHRVVATHGAAGGDTTIERRVVFIGIGRDGLARVGHVPVDLLRKPVDRLRCQTHRLAHIAHRRAAAPADDLGRQRRPMPAPAAVDPLDHLLATLVLEVHVDVGRLVALAADEALEERVHAVRIDRRDAQAEAHRAVGRRATTLTEDAATSREGDDLVHREEVGLVAQLSDERELVLQPLRHRLGHPLRPALDRPLLGECAQVRERRDPLGRAVARIAPAHLLQ
jgi:hypothetical protein